MSTPSEPACRSCGTELEGYAILRGLCRDCAAAVAPPPGVATDGPPRPPSKPRNRIVLSTETAPSIAVTRRLGIVAAECVFGLHLGRDILAAVRDVAGGRSATLELALADGRRTVLDALRAEAHVLGADAVIAVAVHYSEIAGGGKNMILVAATGTAIQTAQGL